MNSLIQHYGYLALFFLSILESACIPIPSEATFGFAGALSTAAVAHSLHMAPFNLVIVIVVGVAGSLVGSIVAYEVGRSAGRTIVDKYGRRILLTHKDLDTAEAWFARFGAPSVLVGRMIPVVRTVISLPAGLGRMNRGLFALLTTLGCAGWVTLLAILGRVAGDNWHHVAGTFHTIQWPVLILIVIAVTFGVRRRLRTLAAEQN
ncbi:MAG: DedA family protein [Actinomycetota bacterium]|jgi:uncharacterized membrane protein YdjX (TVP38/TMEM64 family)